MRMTTVGLAAGALVGFIAGACAPGSDTVAAPPTSASSSGSTGGGSTSSTSSTSTTSTSSTGGAGGMGGGGGGGMGGCNFDAPDTCQTAETLIEISANSGADVRTVKGTGSKWFQIKMNDDTVAQLRFTATLTSAMDTDYDLYVHRGDDNAPDCNFPAVKAMGTPEVAAQFWADELGNDNSRWYSFEVFYVSGSECDMPHEWTLTIEGNKFP
jgi:hypothetical protein